jgi:UDP-N-acetylmuramyl tripeptide synthase
MNYEYILSKLSKKQIIYTYGMNYMADFKFCNVNMYNTHTNFELVYKNMSYMVTIVLIGLHNVYNFVSCLVYLIHCGYNINDLIFLSDKIQPPDGRLEEIYPNIYVDYAHTPIAIKSVISYFRQTSSKKIIVVFGSGGKSGNIKMIKEKRQMMATEAQVADFLIITSDNSRNEDINVICKNLYDNINHMNKKIIVDRYKAIEYAITNYSDYIILVLGKGNEKFIKQDGKQIEFNDKNIIKQINRIALGGF